jgi:hypothetical protein
MTDGFAAMCADFKTISRQFYATSFIYCVLSLVFVYILTFFPNLNLNENYWLTSLFMTIALAVPATAVFINCKILDRVQPGLRNSNALLAAKLYVRLYAISLIVIALLSLILYDFRKWENPPSLIAGVVFANWLFIRYRACFGSMGKSLKWALRDLFLLYLLIYCGGSVVVAAYVSFKPAYTPNIYNYAARALIPISVFLPALLLRGRRFLPREFREMYRDFDSRVIAGQFYITSLTYCAVFSLIAWGIFKVSDFTFFFFDPRIFHVGWFSMAVTFFGCVVFLNCKILDRFRSDLKSSNIILAPRLYIHLYAVTFLISLIIIICGCGKVPLWLL